MTVAESGSFIMIRDALRKKKRGRYENLTQINLSVEDLFNENFDHNHEYPSDGNAHVM